MFTTQMSAVHKDGWKLGHSTATRDISCRFKFFSYLFSIRSQTLHQGRSIEKNVKRKLSSNTLFPCVSSFCFPTTFDSAILPQNYSLSRSCKLIRAWLKNETSSSLSGLRNLTAAISLHLSLRWWQWQWQWQGLGWPESSRISKPQPGATYFVQYAPLLAEQQKCL